MVTVTKLSSNMGLEGIHSPEALHWWGGYSYCPWCAKEGQNDGTIVNHLCIVHYHLDLVCTLCMAFFAMSVDTMRKHGPTVRPQPLGIRTGQRRRYPRTAVVTRMMGTSLRNSNSRDCVSCTLHQPAHTLSTCLPWQQWCEFPKPLNSTIIQDTHTFIFTTCVYHSW